MSTHLFSYRHVSGVPLCPCGDPGNYLRAEQPGDDPMVVKFICWCGSSNTGRFESMEERAEFLQTHQDG